MPHINIEIKARCHNPERMRGFLSTRNARFVGLDHQIDTYFHTSAGRLKLREGNIENNLIFYERDDSSGPKRSDVSLMPVEHANALKEILTRSFGVKVVVDKKREIYFIDNVKFHIDEVAGLGSFVEIEAIDERGDIGETRLLAQCEEYLKLLEIAKSDLITNSYSDILMGHDRPDI